MLVPASALWMSWWLRRGKCFSPLESTSISCWSASQSPWRASGLPHRRSGIWASWGGIPWCWPCDRQLCLVYPRRHEASLIKRWLMIPYQGHQPRRLSWGQSGSRWLRTARQFARTALGSATYTGSRKAEATPTSSESPEWQMQRSFLIPSPLAQWYPYFSEYMEVSPPESW